jgi:hypothetical protein
MLLRKRCPRHRPVYFAPSGSALYLVQVKKPAESTGPWDYYKMLSLIPGDKVFRSLEDGGCSLAGR